MRNGSDNKALKAKFVRDMRIRNKDVYRLSQTDRKRILRDIHADKVEKRMLKKNLRKLMHSDEVINAYEKNKNELNNNRRLTEKEHVMKRKLIIYEKFTSDDNSIKRKL